MEAEKTMASFLNPNVQLDRFDGTNFTRWKGKLFFLLTVLKIAYVLDPNLLPISEAKDDDTDEEKAARKKRQDDEVMCRGHILNTLSDRLYDLYNSMETPKEIWNALEYKYKTEKEGTDKFLILKYLEFTMVDTKSVLDQIHELQVLVTKLRELKVEISEPFQVGAVIAKLPQSWNDYRKKLLHRRDDITLEELQKHLRIEEETRSRDHKSNPQDSSKVNVAEANKFQKNFKVNNDKKFKKSGNDQKKFTGNCYFCGKKGHRQSDCRFKKKKEENNSNNANMVKEKFEEICAMVSEMQIGMITELNMAAATKSFDWWLDSGATIHVCNDRTLFSTYAEEKDGQSVLMGNHDAIKVVGKGSVELQFTSGKKLLLKNVFHVPEIRKNLVSASLLCKNGLKVVLESENCILTKNGSFVGKGYSCDGMFKLSINKMMNSAYMVDSVDTWHARLAHLNFRSLKYMSKHGLISFRNVSHEKCEICIQAKMTKKPFPKAERNTQILDLIHSDICEYNGVLTRGGKRYFITFIDDCSRFTYVYLLRTKDEAFDKFKLFKAEVENQKEKKIKMIRSDRGGEYFSNEFDAFCKQHGIIYQRTAPFTPQQNGLAERKNRTFTDMINSMLLNARLPNNLWGEALLTACHVHNRIPSMKTHVSPYEIWKDRKPNLMYLRVWGCIAFYRVHDPKSSKLGPRGIKSVFVGYAENSKAYRLLNLDSNVVVESRDVEFIENKFINDTTTKLESVFDPPCDLSPGSFTSNKRKESEKKFEPRRSQRERKEKSLAPDFISSQALAFLVEGDRNNVLNKIPLLLNIEEDPKTFGEAMSSRDASFWREAVNDEMDSIMSNQTWFLVDLPTGSKPISSKWVFRRKYNADGSIQTFKARLVAKGFKQKQGIDYFDTYAPVARLTSIRVLMAIASIHHLYVHQMDVKTAFLNGDLDEEIYMEQPEGFVLPGNEKKVCKLVKSLYGLKQSPKQWHGKFDSVILAHGFKHNNADKCIYSKFTDDFGVIICLYVDDLLIFGTNMQGVSDTKKYLTSQFKMKDLGEVDTILGIKVKKNSGGFSLCQSQYIEKVLLKFNHLKFKEANTPYDSSIKLLENSGRAVAQLEYASAIGSLMYVVHCTRPDIAFAVCKMSRYTSNPSTEHWKAIGRILGYLKRTINLGLFYNEYPEVLEGYSDASWITSASDNKSTSGWIFIIGRGAVSWSSKKQTCITHSTMESEFIALAAAGKEAEWLRNLLFDIKLWPQPMPSISLYCDSEATLSRAYNKVYNGKSRHISLRHEYVKQLITDGVINVVYVRSNKNLADPLTKGLSRDLVKDTSNGMGLKLFFEKNHQ